jgi:Fe-Mn family superoxide dismutase
MYKLPELPYSYDALEPHIDAETMGIHHGKHHAGYVTKLNTALEGHEGIEEMEITDILTDIAIVQEDTRAAVINNGGGHANLLGNTFT